MDTAPNSEMSAERIAKGLGGRKVGTGWIARCPAHPDRNPSFSIQHGADGKVLVRCHAGCDQELVIAKLRSQGLWSAKRQNALSDFHPEARHRPFQRNHSAVNRLRASALWQEAIPIIGTMGAHYLATRGLCHQIIDRRGEVLRFHPSCPFGPAQHPCLLALMRDISTNEPQAIQRTALTASGEKIGRMTLGPKANAAIKLSANEDVATGLVVGEGLETVFSAMRLGFRPAWALVDAGNLRSFRVLSGIECLTVIVDNDESGTGQEAALECSLRWTNAGREVFRIIADRRGMDLNDLVRGNVI